MLVPFLARNVREARYPKDQMLNRFFFLKFSKVEHSESLQEVTRHTHVLTGLRAT